MTDFKEQLHVRGMIAKRVGTLPAGSLPLTLSRVQAADYMRKTPGTDAFRAAYRKLLNDSETGATAVSLFGPRRVLPGTWRCLCVQYFASAEFKQLDSCTDALFGRCS